MTKKSLLILSFCFFEFFNFTKTAFAFTNNFILFAEEELVTVAGHPSKTYPVTVHLETPMQQTVYLTGLDFPTESSYSATNSWLSFDASNLSLSSGTNTLTFYISIPSSIASGEYYKALAVSDIAFDDSESTNPPTLLSIPLTIQVSPDTTENITTTSSSTSTTSSSTSTTSTTQTTNPPPTTTPTAKPKKSIPTKTKPATLFSKINLDRFFSFYSLSKQSSTLNITLSNSGNISADIFGNLEILNSQNNPIKSLSLPKQIIRPNSSTKITLSLEKPKYLIGAFEASLFINNEKYPIIKFFHLGTYPLFIIIITILLYSYFYHSKKKNIIIFIGLSALTLCYYLSHFQTKIAPLGTQTDLSITATVKEMLGLKSIINDDLTKTIQFTSTNPLGSRLYTLQNGVRTDLDEILQYSYGAYKLNLSYPNDSYPLMMTTKGY